MNNNEHSGAQLNSAVQSLFNCKVQKLACRGLLYLPLLRVVVHQRQLALASNFFFGICA